MTRTNWREDANCTPADDNLFFPDSLVSATGQFAIAKARGICAACPVLRQCRADVLATERGVKATGRFGIVAGMTPEERYNAHRAEVRERTGKTAPPTCGTTKGYRQHLREGSEQCGPCLAAQKIAARRAQERRIARRRAGGAAAAAAA